MDADKLLKNVQGLGSPDYDLYHYDEAGGFLTKKEDPDKDSKTSHVAVYHFWTTDASKRSELLSELNAFADQHKSVDTLQSALVLKAIVIPELATLWIRTKTQADYKAFEPELATLTKKLAPITAKVEVNQSRSFIGHLDLK